MLARLKGGEMGPCLLRMPARAKLLLMVAALGAGVTASTARAASPSIAKSLLAKPLALSHLPVGWYVLARMEVGPFSLRTLEVEIADYTGVAVTAGDEFELRGAGQTGLDVFLVMDSTNDAQNFVTTIWANHDNEGQPGVAIGDLVGLPNSTDVWLFSDSAGVQAVAAVGNVIVIAIPTNGDPDAAGTMLTFGVAQLHESVCPSEQAPRSCWGRYASDD